MVRGLELAIPRYCGDGPGRQRKLRLLVRRSLRVLNIFPSKRPKDFQPSSLISPYRIRNYNSSVTNIFCNGDRECPADLGIHVKDLFAESWRGRDSVRRRMI